MSERDTKSEEFNEVLALLKRVDEDAKGTRCLTMAEVTMCLNVLKRLLAPGGVNRV